MTPNKTCTHHNTWLLTCGLQVWVDVGTGMGTLKSTHRLPVPLPTDYEGTNKENSWVPATKLDHDGLTKPISLKEEKTTNV